jgi:hypothetical protein
MVRSKLYTVIKSVSEKQQRPRRLETAPKRKRVTRS